MLGNVIDEERCYRAVCSRDGRFDGAFFTAVTTTGIYCRPSCPATTPKRANVRFFTTAAAAQEAGFRACKRCRPDAAPGSPEWIGRGDTVARSMRLIGDGVVDREGVGGLARRLGYSSRQLHRIVFAELGTGPLTLARAHRVQHARILIETTDLPVSEVAWASGFASIRQFNDSVLTVYGLSPRELRRRASSGRRHLAGPGEGIPVRLAYRPPFDLAGVLEFLASRVIAGVESWDGSTYRRVLTLPRGAGILSVSGVQRDEGIARSGYLECTLALDDNRDFVAAVARARRLFDLDADPVAVGSVLGADSDLAALVGARPGLRVPGAVDGVEIAIRAVLGQQVSVPTARRITARISESFGKPLQASDGALCREFPSAEALAGSVIEDLPLPPARASAVRSIARAVCNGSLVLDPGTDRDAAEQALLSLPGIGGWTASYVRMRALGDPDVFLDSDLGIKKALVTLDQTPGRASSEAIGVMSPATRAQGWRPWRSYATVHLWAAGHPAGQRKPQLHGGNE